MENNKQGIQNMKAWMKKHPIITVILGIVVLVFIINLFSGSSASTTQTSQPTPQKAEKPTVSKEQAQKDLTDFMETAKKAKLVSSYEFSDKATEVFIDSAWYTQKVDFKKDFIAKIGMHPAYTIDLH